MAGINLPPQQQPVKSSPSKVVSSQPRSTTGATRPDSVPITDSLTLESAQLFMSCLHAWGLDLDLDKLCTNKLGLLKPQCPISFGLLSRQGHMSLMLPGWHKRVCQEELSAIRGDHHAASKTLAEQARMHGDTSKDRRPSSEPVKLTLLAQRSGSVPFDVEHLMFVSEDSGAPESGSPFDDPPVPAFSKIADSLLQQETRIFSAKARWQISSGVTTQHLLSVISVANTLMSMSHSSFLKQRQSKR